MRNVTRERIHKGRSRAVISERLTLQTKNLGKGLSADKVSDILSQGLAVLISKLFKNERSVRSEPTVAFSDLTVETLQDSFISSDNLFGRTGKLASHIVKRRVPVRGIFSTLLEERSVIILVDKALFTTVSIGLVRIFSIVV